MTYFKRYFINFLGMPDEDSSGRSYRADFWKRYADGSAVPDIVELTGSGSPFLQTLSDSEDPLTALRASTARISFIDDISLSELLPSDGFEWKVTLTRTDDDKQLFVGYLTAEVYTQPIIEGPNIVTVNAVSPLTPICATTMKLLGVGSLSIGRLLHLAISECEGITQVAIPAQFTIAKATALSDFTDILRWQISSANFIKTSDSGVVTGKNFECEPYSVALEAICKLFGWSLTDIGDGTLYFVSPGYTGQYMVIGKNQLLAAGFVPTVITPSVSNEGAIFPVDAEDTVDFRQGVGSAMIKIAATTAAIESPSVEMQIKQWSYGRSEQKMWKTNGATVDAAVGMRQAVLSNGQIVTPRYRPTAIYNSSGILSSVEWSVVEDGSAGENDVVAEYIELDSCAPSAIESTDDMPAEKRSWNFQSCWKFDEQRRFSVGDGGVSFAYVPDSWPYLTFRGRAGLLTSGAINISFDVRAAWNEAFFLADNYTFGGGNIEGTIQEELAINSTSALVNPIYWGLQKNIKASLRVGDFYWNGSQWVNSFARFDIPISVESAEWHPVLSNKTIDMPYAGSEGLFIPVTTSIGGPLEFSLYPRMAQYSGTPSRPDNYLRNGVYEAATYIRGLSVSFANSLDYSDASEGGSSFYKDFGLSFFDKKEESLPIHSRINSSEQMSLLYDGNATAIDAVNRITSNNAAKPEQFLLANFERLYAQVSRRWRRGMELREMKPIDIFSISGKAESVLTISGSTTNYALGVVELRLTEVKSESSVRYVE